MEREVPSPLHIGILCDYGFTLVPKSGIGVFVYNLIDGLLTLCPRPKITLLAHPGDQKALAEYAQRWQDRVGILPPLGEGETAAVRIERWLTRLYQRCLNLESALNRWWIGLISKPKQRALTLLKNEWWAWRDLKSEIRNPKAKTNSNSKIRNLGFGFRILSGVVRMAFWVMLLGAGSWIAEIFQSLILGFVWPTLVLPIHLSARIALAARGAAQPLHDRMAAADCDVWLVPFPGMRTAILAPHVLVIFDMVFRHVPEVYSDRERDQFQRLFSERAREATLIYCGSNFVKEHDLIPCFPSVADRIRVFRLAPPLDLQPGAPIADVNSLGRKYRTPTRFLFYPAALRAHKNHAMLVRALRLLHQKPGYSELALVFTGEGRQSPELLHLVHSEGLTESVHFLGLIDRQDVQAFYRHALLVPLPSLHEGYGLPLLEALQNQCPVVCAEIPAFRELLEDQSDAVPFFNPHDANAIAEAVSLTIARQEEFRHRQSEAYRKIARRDWHAVARDFLEIFEEAYRLGQGGARTAECGMPKPESSAIPHSTLRTPHSEGGIHHAA